MSFLAHREIYSLATHIKQKEMGIIATWNSVYTDIFFYADENTSSTLNTSTSCPPNDVTHNISTTISSSHTNNVTDVTDGNVPTTISSSLTNNVTDGNVPTTISSSPNDANSNINKITDEYFTSDLPDQTSDTVITQSSISSGFYIGGSSGLVVMVFLTGIVVLVIILFIQKKKRSVRKESIINEVTNVTETKVTNLSDENISTTKNEAYGHFKGRSIGMAVNTLTQCNVESHDLELYSEVTCEQEVPDTGTYMDVNQAYGKLHDSKNEVIVTSENEAYGQTSGREINPLAQFNTEDILDNDYI